MDDYLGELLGEDGVHTPDVVEPTECKVQADAFAVGPFVTMINPNGPGPRAYFGYATDAERREHMFKLIQQGHEVIERIDGSKPCRPCLDFDGDIVKRGSLPTDDEIAEAREAFEGLANGLIHRIDPSGAVRVVESGYDTATKRSRHFVAIGLRLADGADVLRFAKTVQAVLPPESAIFVDPLGTDKTFGLRLPGCPKEGDKARILRPSGEFDLLDHLLQVEDGSPVDEKMSQTKTSARTTPAVISKNLDAIVARVAVECPWLGPPVFESVAGRDDIVAKFERLAPHHCEVCDRSHDRRGAYLCVNGPAAYLRCFASAITKPALMAAGVSNGEDAPDRFDGLFDCEDLTSINSRYISDGIQDNGEDIYIGSAWGTGKNHFINSTLPANPIAVAFIGSRISLTSQYMADVAKTMHSASAIISYKDIKDAFSLSKYPMSVWQLEAALRIPAETVFENLILDEITATILHAYGGVGFKGEARKAMSLLRHLIRNAKRIIVADNDLTTAQVDAIRQLRTGKQFTIYRNDAQPWLGTPARIVTGRVKVGGKKIKATDYVLNALFARCNQQFEEMQRGGAWRGTIAPCHSRKQADWIYKEAVRRYGASLIKLHTGESDDFQKRIDFADAGAAWAGKLLVIYTGTVSVGVSANIDHFDQVFAFFNRGNAPAASSAQMFFRARQVKAITIAFTGGKTKGLPTTPEALFKWITKANRRKWIPDEFRDDRTPHIEEPSSSDPIALEKMLRGFEGQMFICAKMEEFRSQTDFVGRLSAILSRAGLDVTTEGDAPDIPETETPTSGEDTGPSREKVMAQNIVTAADHAEELTEEQREAEKFRDKTYEDKAGRRALALAKVFDVDPRALQDRDDWIEHYEPHAEAFSHLRSACYTTAPKQENTLVIRSEREAIELTRKTMMTLGLSMAGDPSTITRKDFEKRAAIIAPEINDTCLRLYGDANGARRKGKTDQRALKAAIGTAIGYIGASLLPTYATARDAKDKRNATSFKLAWAWDFSILDGAPVYRDPAGEQPPKFFPRPAHPITFTPAAPACLDDVYEAVDV